MQLETGSRRRKMFLWRRRGNAAPTDAGWLGPFTVEDYVASSLETEIYGDPCLCVMRRKGAALEERTGRVDGAVRGIVPRLWRWTLSWLDQDDLWLLAFWLGDGEAFEPALLNFMGSNDKYHSSRWKMDLLFARETRIFWSNSPDFLPQTS